MDFCKKTSCLLEARLNLEHTQVSDKKMMSKAPYKRSALLLAALSLATVAHGGVDSNGEQRQT